MRRGFLLPLVGLSLISCAGGCSTFIADKVLVPPRNMQREASLVRARHRIEARWDDKLTSFTYTSFDGTELAGMMFQPRVPFKRHDAWADLAKGLSVSEATDRTDESLEEARAAQRTAAPVKPRGVIVIIHGLTDRKESMLSVGEAFAEAGYLAVCPDLRAHGESGGKYTTLGYYEKRDMMALLNYLNRLGYDVSHAGAMGGSLGAAVSIQWAAVDPRVKSVVAVAPFSDLRTELNYLYGRFDIQGWLSALLESSAQSAGRFRIADVSPIKSLKVMDTPLYLAHGYLDTLIPDKQSEKLFEAARGPVVFHHAISGHIDIRDALGKSFMQQSIDWMDLYVPADAHPTRMPEWVEYYAARNLPLTAPVATNDASPSGRRVQ